MSVTPVGQVPRLDRQEQERTVMERRRYRMKVPSENCIIRGTYVCRTNGKGCGFLLYPSNFSEGNSSGMNATIVTEASGSGTNSSSSASGGQQYQEVPSAQEILPFRVQKALHQKVDLQTKSYRAVSQKLQSRAVNRKLRVRTAVHWTVQKD